MTVPGNSVEAQALHDRHPGLHEQVNMDRQIGGRHLLEGNGVGADQSHTPVGQPFGR